MWIGLDHLETLFQAHKFDSKFHGDFQKADVFSTGMVIYELLHGERPFTEDELSTEDRTLPFEHTTNVKVNALMASIREMLVWNPTDRCDAYHAKTSLLSKVR